MTSGIKKEVSDKKQNELEAGWKVSETNSEIEYLDFKDLEKVIRNNWNECFKSYFHDQAKVNHRLTMLEAVRNSIAHTRILTIDSMNRLEQHYNDLMNMMKASLS